MDPGQGIPDIYDGKVLMRKDQLSTAVSMTASFDTFICTVPLPGVAYLSITVASGTFPTATSNWQPTYYPGYYSGTTGLAGNTSYWTGDNVTAFRYASSCVGIYPTSSIMNSSGAIQVWRAPIKLEIAQRRAGSPPGPSGNYYAVTGLESTSGVGPENFTTKFLDGCYSVATCNQPDFDFQTIITGLDGAPVSGILPSEVDQYGYVSAPVAGIGFMDTTIIRLTAPAGTSNSFVIKTWNCVEYQVNPTSPLYMYAGTSPSHDPVALELYHRIKKNLPVAVTAAQNAGFWSRVLNIIQSVSKVASYIPGPIGMIAGGVNNLANVIDSI